MGSSSLLLCCSTIDVVETGVATSSVLISNALATGAVVGVVGIVSGIDDLESGVGSAMGSCASSMVGSSVGSNMDSDVDVDVVGTDAATDTGVEVASDATPDVDVGAGDGSDGVNMDDGDSLVDGVMAGAGPNADAVSAAAVLDADAPAAAAAAAAWSCSVSMVTVLTWPMWIRSECLAKDGFLNEGLARKVGLFDCGSLTAAMAALFLARISWTEQTLLLVAEISDTVATDVIATAIHSRS
jgi:hypothetical protein